MTDVTCDIPSSATWTASTVAAGPATGARALDLRVWNGIDLRLLPDRGLDAGAAWHRGVPLAWISPLGERPARPDDFIGSWSGGLVTTCGLHNVGPASEGHPVHGRLHQQPAGAVSVERTVDGEAVVLRARGVVEDGGALGCRLRLEREWTVRTGVGLLELRDVTTNVGAEPAAAPLLYHVNVGEPLWSPGATVDVSGSTAPADEAMRRAPARDAAPSDAALEHAFAPDGDGWGAATVDSPAAGLRLTLRWRAAELPRLHQWTHVAPGTRVLALEPANTGGGGRAADRAEGRLAELPPGAARETRLSIEVAPR